MKRSTFRLQTILTGALILVIAAGRGSAAQFGRPTGTVAAGGWTASGAPTVHEALDEVSPNGETDHIAASGNTTAEVTLGALQDPSSSTGHVIRFSMRTSGAGAKERCEVQLLQGTTLIASTGAQQNRDTVYGTFSYTLLAPEADAITDYGALRLRIVSSSVGGGEEVRVTWAELEVPSAAAATPPTLSNPSVSTVDLSGATLGATIDSDGGAPISERGTVWNTTGPPITQNTLAEGGTALGAFSHGRSALPSGARIYFRGYAVNSAGTGYSPDGSFYTEPTQASTVGFSSVQTNSMTISWSPGGGDGAIVIVKQGVPVDSGPADGTEHTASSVFGSGEQLGTGNWVVFRGSGTQVTVTGLSGSTTYHAAVYEYAGTGTGVSGVNYQQDGPGLGSQATAGGGPSPPTLSAPTVSGVDLDLATLGATVDADGGASLTARGTAWNTTGSPITENSLAEGGTAVGSFTHSRGSLPSGTRIYFRGYAVNSAGTGYSPDGSFYTEPSPASALGFANVQASSMTISWTAGGGDGVIIVVKQGAPVDAVPVDGTEHVASATFGSGEDLGAGNYVVYRGPATQVMVTGLVADTLYYAAAFESAGSGGGGSGVNYQQDGSATGNQSTTSTPSGHNALHGIECDQCHAMHGFSPVPRGLEQETVCKTCHNESGAASAKSAVGLHVVNGGATTIDCGSCHEIHNFYDFNTVDVHPGGVTAENLARIRRDTSKYVPGALEPALFQQSPQHFAFGSTNSPYNGICQTCHQNTKNHTNDGWDDDDAQAANNDHEVGGDCMSCHPHTDGFKGAGGCTACHGNIADNSDGGPTRRAILSEFSLTSHHAAGAAVTDDDCAVCHYEAIDTLAHKNNQVDLRDPDTGAPIAAFTKLTRDRSSDALEAWISSVQDNFCMKCHDADGATATHVAAGSPLRPFSATAVDVPDVHSNFDPANTYHHAVRGPAANPFCVPNATNGNNITMVAPWNQDANHDMISCFDCHFDVVTDPDGTPHLLSGHGGGNQRALRSAIDLDAMETGTLSTAIGSQVEGFCSICHKGTVYVTGSDPEAVGSVFEYHPGSQGQHGAAGGNELGCMGCHGGVVDYGPPAPNNGGGRGNLHGGSFVWPTGTFSAGVSSETFMLGGWIGGWDTGTDRQGNPEGYCGGGDCNHTGSASKNGQSYSR